MIYEEVKTLVYIALGFIRKTMVFFKFKIYEPTDLSQLIKYLLYCLNRYSI